MALLRLVTVGVALFATKTWASVLGPRADATLDRTSLTLLTDAADAQVQSTVDGRNASYSGSPRNVARGVRRLVAPFVWPNSTYYHDESLVPVIEEMLAVLTSVQHCDGTYSVGNRHSPPDTGFLIEDFGLMVHILEADDHDASPAFADTIRAILVRAGRALAVGGIHTPNHRWKICGALSRISRLTDDDSLLSRVDEWLAEGIDIDADGIYSERSPNYYSAVSNPSLLTVARELNRTELVDYVRRNLELTIEHAESGGEVETVISRRQDQTQPPTSSNLLNFYLQFRELALLDDDGRFAFMARLIEEELPTQLGDFLGDVIERSELAALLPASEDPFVDFEKHYRTAGLVRTRRGKLTTSTFGGSDWYSQGRQTPFYNRFGSGLSTNPTLFRAWNGGLVLDAIRVVPNFFTMGHFRSNGISYSDGVAKLGSEMEVPYYLPMPADQRDEDGVYALSRSTADGRFYAMLDFDNRPASMRRLKTEVSVVPTDKGYDLEFEISGERDVEITLELTLRGDGTVTGAEQIQVQDGSKSYHLVDGYGEYTVGDDTIKFGPGNGKGLIQAEAGEQYSWHGGSLSLPGTQVYITGKSPLNYTLSLEFS